MDYQVIYFSKSSRQNTRMIAETIASALKVPARRVTAETKYEPSKLLFVGSGVYMWHSGKELLKFIDSMPQCEGQKVAIFQTHGGNNKEALAELSKKLEEKGCIIEGTWDCLGQWAFFTRGHPTEQEVHSAVKWALEMAEKTQEQV